MVLIRHLLNMHKVKIYLNLENVVDNLGLIPGYTFVEISFFSLIFVAIREKVE